MIANSSTPQRQPNYFKPDTEPHQANVTDGSSFKDQGTEEKGDQYDEYHRDDVRKVSNEETRVMNLLESLGNPASRILWRPEGGSLLVNRIGIDIELVNRLNPRA